MDEREKTFLSPNERERLEKRFDVALFLLALIPLLFSQSGRISDDTKAYLYLNPQHLLATASSMWNADQGFGMVTHQNIGFLFPMGPFFWLCHSVGIATWISQRLWMGLILAAAGIGVRRFLRFLGFGDAPAVVGAIFYMLSPYLLVNVARTSAILLPWAGLGWIMRASLRSLDDKGWREPAKVALVVAIVGGTNATSILLVAVAPFLWISSLVLQRRVTMKRAASAYGRIGILSLMVSLWWIVGLWVEGRYGLNVPQFTETMATVSQSSSVSEVFRGLGYWYFYGGDHGGLWTDSATVYTTGWLIPSLSFIVPAVALIAGLVLRGRYRRIATTLIVVSVVIAVGCFPYKQPTLFGTAVKWFGNNTSVGLALRSTNRIVPVMLLGMAVLIASLLSAAERRGGTRTLNIVAGAIVALSCATLWPLWSGSIIPSDQTSPSALPAYVTNAANYLNSHGSGFVLGLPGQDFGNTTYGAYNDSPWPGILSRPYVASQASPQGEPASINLVRALDQTLQLGIAQPSSIAPISRLLNADSILVQSDTQFWRYLNPSPAYLGQLFAPAPPGTNWSRSFGPRTNVHSGGHENIDEQTLGLHPGFTWPRQLEIFTVSHPRGLLRLENTDTPMIVSGDGSGLVEMADAGLLNNTRPIFYEAKSSKQQLKKLAATANPLLVLTDSNKNRLDTFSTLSRSLGYVMSASQTSSGNPAQTSLNLFPGQSMSSRTVSVMSTWKQLDCSSYGDANNNTAETGPWAAFDSNALTSWQTASNARAIGQWISASSWKPVAFKVIRIAKSSSFLNTRSITSVGIQVDGGKTYLRHLSASGITRVTIPRTIGRTLRITIKSVSWNDSLSSQHSEVGLSGISVDGVMPGTNSLRLPTRLLTALGAQSSKLPIDILLSRDRVAQFAPRTDPETSLQRLIVLTDRRSFQTRGMIGLNSQASDATLAKILHRNLSGDISSTESSSRLTGTLSGSSWNAFDRSESSAWTPEFHDGVGSWVSAQLRSPRSISHVVITIRDDKMHSIPTEIVMSGVVGSRMLRLDASHLLSRGDGLVRFAFDLAPLRTSAVRFTVSKEKELYVSDILNPKVPQLAPISINTISMNKIAPASGPLSVNTCTDQLLSVNQRSVAIRISASVHDLLEMNSVPFTTCTSDSLSLVKGVNSISTSLGADAGFDINTLNFFSDDTAPTHVSTDTASAAAGRWTSRSSLTTAVHHGAGELLVLAQSYSNGWHAFFGSSDLGPGQLVDGASNGWILPKNLPAIATIDLVFVPQSSVTVSEWMSLASLLLILSLIIFRRRLESPLANLDSQMVIPAPRRESLWIIAPSILAIWLCAGTIPTIIALLISLFARFSGRRLFAATFAAGSMLLIARFTEQVAHATTAPFIAWASLIPHANSIGSFVLALLAFDIVLRPNDTDDL